MLQNVPDSITSLILSKLTLQECHMAALTCKCLQACANEPLAQLSAVCTIRRYWRWWNKRGRIQRLLLSLETIYTKGNEMVDPLPPSVFGLAKRVRTLRLQLRSLDCDALTGFDARMRDYFGW